MRGAVHMQITTIGLDIAKNVFKFTALTRPRRSSSGDSFAAARLWRSSKLWRRA
jgi:hypothetical protein